MANKLSLLIHIGGKVDGSLTTALTETNTKIGKLSKVSSIIGKKMTATVTAPIAGVAAASVKSFGDVDKQLRLVQQTMGSTPGEAAKLEKAIKKAASASVYSMQDAADATLNFARQGFNAKQSADMITPALNLAAGTGTDLAATTEGLGNTLKAFGAKSGEATHYADMFAKAQAQANTNAQGLFDAMSVAGSTAKTVGWSFSDLATITGVFGDHSIGASEGATALNTGLMRLASPAKQGAQAMEQLGINVFDSKGQLKDMPSVMQELSDKFKGLSSEEKLSAASAIFGKQQASKWLTLIQTSPSKFKSMKKAIDETDGSAKNMADALMEGVGGSIEKLKSTFDVFKYNVGKVAGNEIKGFIDRITDLLDAFNNLPDSAKSASVKTALAVAGIGPALSTFSRVTKGIQNTKKNFEALQNAFQGGKLLSGLGSMTINKPVSPFTMGPQTLEAPIIQMKNLPAAAGQSAKAFGYQWKTQLAASMATIKAGPIATKLSTPFSKAGSLVTGYFTAPFKGVGKALSKFASVGSKGLGKVLMGVASHPIIAGIAAVGVGLMLLYKYHKQIGAVASKVWTKFATFIGLPKTQIKGLKDSFNGLFSSMGKLGSELGLSESQMKAFRAAVRLVGSIVKRIFVAGFKTWFAVGASAVVTSVQIIVRIIRSIVNVIRHIVKMVKAIARGDWKGAWTEFKNIFKSVWDGIKSIAKSAVNGVIDILNLLISGINSILSFKVPDKKWVPKKWRGANWGVHISKIGHLAAGTANWGGGLTSVNEQGGEIIDLPKGSRVYPHDLSEKYLRNVVSNDSSSFSYAPTVIIQGNANQNDIQQALTLSQKDFDQLLQKHQQKKKARSFRSGKAVLV